MKKITTAIITILCAICFLTNSNASAGTLFNSTPLDQTLIQDTNPRPQRDTSKWGRKKSMDSTGKSRRDTLQLHKF